MRVGSGPFRGVTGRVRELRGRKRLLVGTSGTDRASEGLSDLTSGTLPDPSELLGSQVTPNISATLREWFELVIFDSPPSWPPLENVPARVLWLQSSMIRMRRWTGTARCTIMNITAMRPDAAASIGRSLTFRWTGQ